MKGPRLFCAFPEDLLDQRGAAVLHGAPLACQSLRHGCAAPKGSPWHQGGARSARAVRGAARSKPSKARSVASEPCERSEATMPHCGMLSAKLTEGFFDPSVTAYAVPPFLSSAWSPLCAHGTRLRCSLLHWAYFALFRSTIHNGRLAAPNGLQRSLVHWTSASPVSATGGGEAPSHRARASCAPFPFGKKEALGQCCFLWRTTSQKGSPV